MKGWCQVRRKSGQEEKAAETETRGWEEFKIKFPYLAHYWRCGEWREVVKEWSVERLERMEAARKVDTERRMATKSEKAQNKKSMSYNLIPSLILSLVSSASSSLNYLPSHSLFSC